MWELRAAGSEVMCLEYTELRQYLGEGILSKFNTAVESSLKPLGQLTLVGKEGTYAAPDIWMEIDAFLSSKLHVQR